MLSKKFYLLGTVVVSIMLVSTAFVAAEDGLIAHYAFEGNLADTTGTFGAGELIGTMIGPSVGEVTNQRGGGYYSASYVDGVKGSALEFNGSFGVLLPTGLIDSNTYTLSLWINPAAITQHTTTFFGAKNYTSWISVVPAGPGSQHTMLWSGEAWFDATTGLTIPTNEWTHFVATVDNGSVVVYLNGEQKFSGTNFPDVFTTATDSVFALGVNWWDLPFIGMLDELKIYNTVVKPEQIAD